MFHIETMWPDIHQKCDVGHPFVLRLAKGVTGYVIKVKGMNEQEAE